jgi:hypothetical protein
VSNSRGRALGRNEWSFRVEGAPPKPPVVITTEKRPDDKRRIEKRPAEASRVETRPDARPETAAAGTRKPR